MCKDNITLQEDNKEIDSKDYGEVMKKSRDVLKNIPGWGQAKIEKEAGTE